MKNIYFLTIVLILCLLVLGCVVSSVVSGNQSVLNNGRIVKVIPEDNVTCYVFDNYYGGGISCMRDKRTSNNEG